MSNLENRENQSPASTENGQGTETAEEQKLQPTSKKSNLKNLKNVFTSKKRIPIIAGGAILVVAIVLLLVFLLPGGGGSDSSSFYEHWSKTWTDVNGDIHEIKEDGTYTLVESQEEQWDEDYKYVIRTTDDKYVIYEKESEEGLFCNTTDRNHEALISDKTGLGMWNLVNSGIYYTETDENDDEDNQVKELYFYNFGNGNKILLAENYVDYAYDMMGEQIIFINGNHEAMFFAPGYSAPKSLGKIEGVENFENLNILTAAKDGSLLFLSEDEEITKDNYTVQYYCLDGGKFEKIGTVENSEYSSSITRFNETGNEALICPLSGDSIFYKIKGQPAKEINVDGKEIQTIYPIAPLDTFGAKAETFEIFYCTTRDEETRDITLYCIDKNLNVKKIASNIYSRDIRIHGGIATYIKNEEEGFGTYLCYCPVEGDQIGAEEIISEDVYEFRVSEDGKYIYYMTNWDVDTDFADLYVYDVENGQKNRIESDVNHRVFQISQDGQTVVYLKDSVEFYESAFEWMGEGFIRKWGEEPIKVASNVVWFYPTMPGEYIQEDMIPFVANAHLNGEGALDDQDIIGGLYIYDGKEAKKLADDVIYENYDLFFSLYNY